MAESCQPLSQTQSLLWKGPGFIFGRKNYMKEKGGKKGDNGGLGVRLLSKAHFLLFTF